MTIFALSVGIILCIAASNFFSSSEMSYSSCNEIRLENEAESGGKNAKRAKAALNIINKFDDALGAILIGNNLVNIAASSLTSVFIIVVTGGDKLAWIGTVVVTILVIIFGETIPKIIAKKNANTMAMNHAYIIRGLTWILYPLVWVVVKLVHLITARIKEEPETDDESVEEFQSIIETAEDEGVLDKDKTELLQNAIEFSDISASEVMTARVDVNFIDVEDTEEEIMRFVEETQSSRIPVYQESIDNIIGVLHLNHYLKALCNGEKADIRALIMPPCHVYKTTKLPEVLSALRKAKQQLAIVTDEYGGTLGVVTMEDVLEKLVGDIWDETDEIEEEAVEKAADIFEVDGDMSVADFCDLARIDKGNFDYESETVGGWVIEMLGHYPEKGEEFKYDGISVRVTETGERRVEKVLVKLGV